MRASHRQPTFIAAMLHRLAGIALAVFLPLHFLALGTALKGAGALDTFFATTNNALVKFAEGGIVIALAIHLTLGLRVLAIEFLPLREPTRVVLSVCFAFVFAIGLAFALNLN